MITKQRKLFYFVGDQAFASLEDAQKRDLSLLLEKGCLDPEKPVFAATTAEDAKSQICSWVLANSAAIVDILTTSPRSRLKARKSHGAVRKPRLPKLKPDPLEQPTERN